MISLADNLTSIRAQTKQAKLIAVSKMQNVETIRRALEAGQYVFGENRVQEAAEKFPALRQAFPNIELHLIGALQTNKAHMAVTLFDVIQTLDRRQLADALAKAIHKTGRHPKIYIEVNIGRERQKAGIVPELLQEFYVYCRDVAQLSINGLMCIPPFGQDPRPFFIHMQTLTKELGLKNLSMGMSGDYEMALACGATEVRLGTAIFGERSHV